MHAADNVARSSSRTLHRLGLLTLLLFAAGCATERTVTILHFSDYHSHAVPFYNEGQQDTAGLARAIAYMKERADGAFIFSGGDMINKGSPAWSDKYRCIEWAWLNGLVDAMAFGNHDADYGAEEFARCARSTRYPILSANTRGLAGIEPYAVLEEEGVRLGVFAVAGPDFQALVRVPGVTFTDRAAAARETVKQLREKERADIVVMIGHESADGDESLARAVPGIDVIFGTHGHLQSELRKIDGTETWTISPSQYLMSMSEVRITVVGGRITDVQGRLIPMGSTLPQDEDTARRIARLQNELEADPQYAALFRRIGTTAKEITAVELGDLATRAMREAANTDFAFSTASTFRRSIAPGEILEEELRAAMPYTNTILVYAMKGSDVQRLLDFSASKSGTDMVARVSFHGRPPIDPEKEYTVATTDYMARVAEGYREIFAAFPATDTGIVVNEEVRKALGDGRR